MHISNILKEGELNSNSVVKDYLTTASDGKKYRGHFTSISKSVDIIAALIQQLDYQTARKYWNKLKERLKKEGSQSVTDCYQLKLEAADGKVVF